MCEVKKDKELGMGSEITRRDFLNGVAMGAGATLLGGAVRADTLLDAAVLDEFAPEKAPDYYPPARTGMRGNHDGTFTLAHRLRDGEGADSFGDGINTGESYDLVVVGGGISGLAAAYFFRKDAGKNARILVLDNHDDFGGHAKRNEFRAGGRRVFSYGGTQSIESPGKYSDIAKALISDIGVKTERFYKAFDTKLYSKMGTAAFFDKETFGEDRMVTGMNTTPWPEFLGKAPLSDALRKDIARVYTEKKDYLAGMSVEEKTVLLNKISYAEYLTKDCKLIPDALPFFQTFTHDLFCIGIESVPALACYEAGDDYGSFTYAGFQGLGLPEGGKEEPYIFHFPDGNASIARLLVRSLIPEAIPGSTMEDVVTARADYSKLDAASSALRIRLNSTVVHVQHAKAEKEVQVAYVRGGKQQTVTAKNCVLACYNGMIPYLCPELPEQQKEALSYLVKMVLFMLRTPCKPGLPQRDQNRAGRAELLQTPFSKFERNIRDQLRRMLGGAGFDPAKDIEGITVNRWAHGYAFAPNPLFDPDWKEEEKPWVIGRRPFGRIAIANSDAGASAYTDVAIDQAWRAVSELRRA